MQYNVPCIVAGIIPCMTSKVTLCPSTLACGAAVKEYSIVGSTLFTRTVTKRELISSSVPLRIVEKLDNVLRPLLVSRRLILHPVIAGVLHVSSHVNSSVLLSTLLQVTLCIEVVTGLKYILYITIITLRNHVAV